MSWRHRLPERWYRDVWLVVASILLGLAFWLFASILDDFEKQQDHLTRVAHQNRVTTRALCVLVVNVHEASKLRLVSERRRLQQSRGFLRTVSPAEEANNPELIRRVRVGLQSSRTDVIAARKSAEATKPPATCVRKEHRANRH